MSSLRLAAVCLIVYVAGCATPGPHTASTSPAPNPVTQEALPVVEPLEKRATPLAIHTDDAPSEPVPLSRDGALLTALSNNLSLEVARLNPRIAATYVPEARAAFDPVLMATVSTGQDTRLGALPKRSTSGVLTQSAGSTVDPTASLATQTLQLLSVLEQLNAAAQAPERPVTKTESTAGTMGISETLPTGTQVFLSGAISSTEINEAANDYQGSWAVSVQQALLKGAGLPVNLATLRQARNREAASVHAFRASVLATVREVETTYWEFVLAKETLAIREFGLQLAEEQLRRNQDLFSVGKAIEGDVTAAQAEKAARHADLATARAQVRQTELTLIELLNPAGGNRWKLHFTAIDPPELSHVALDPESSDQLARQYRPELAQAQLQVANLEIDAEKTRNDLWPRLDLTAAYGRTSRGATKSGATRYFDSGDYDNAEVGLNFSMPLLNRAERARNERAQLSQTQGERSLTALELTISAQARQAAVATESQWQRTQAMQEALRNRIEQLRVAQDRNAVGRTTNYDVLLVQRDVIQARLDETAARIGYIEALTALYAAEGTLLERRGIRFESSATEGD